ncbi:MAG: fluoride efflux transporter CrcB [Tenuifilaceae bacterium]
MFRLILIVGLGGFLGTVSRFLAARYVQNHIFTAFPFGTFLVNIVGCFLIGILFGLSEKGNVMNSEWRMFLTVGFCGGFTTFSTFANENLVLLRDGNVFYFALYTSLSVFLGLFATYFGNLLIKIF